MKKINKEECKVYFEILYTQIYCGKINQIIFVRQKLILFKS